MNKSIASTLNTKIHTSWVWLVLAITVGLTVLFYFSQKPQELAYSSYVKSLSDYMQQESMVLRSMEQIRVGINVDTAAFQSQIMTMREMAVSFSREMDELRNAGMRTPSQESVLRFERECLGKTAGMRRYATRRNLWFSEFRHVRESLFEQSPAVQKKLSDLLDSARVGYLVVLNLSDDNISALSEGLLNSLFRLFQENEDLSMAWNSFNNSVSMAYSEDLIRFFKMEGLNEMSLKTKIPVAFYFLSLVLLLSTFFFVFYARR